MLDRGEIGTMLANYFHMKKLILTLISFICLLVAGVSWGDVSSEQALLDRINAARENPVEAAAKVGISETKLFDVAPELKDISDRGLPALKPDCILARTARGHNEDMLARGYTDKVTPEGLTVEERIANSGYWPLITGESIGLVVFANYLPPQVAIEVIFESMLREELLNRDETRWNILNAELTEVGIAFEAGVFAFGGGFFNVYIAVCDYGKPYSPSVEEDFFLTLVNQARSNPSEFMESVGLSVADVMPDLRDNWPSFTLGMPALYPNKPLFQAARSHADDMLLQGYYSMNSIDGRTQRDRIIEAGYSDVLESSELHGCLALCGDRITAEQLKLFFQRAAVSELTKKNPEGRLIFNPDMREAGVGFSEGICEPLGGICGDHIGLIVASFGTRMAYDAGIVGVAFKDINKNGVYDYDEGLAGLNIDILREGMAPLSVSSNSAGAFRSILEAGIYRLLPLAMSEEILVILPIPGESVFVGVSTSSENLTDS